MLLHTPLQYGHSGAEVLLVQQQQVHEKLHSCANGIAGLLVLLSVQALTSSEKGAYPLVVQMHCSLVCSSHRPLCPMPMVGPWYCQLFLLVTGKSVVE